MNDFVVTHVFETSVKDKNSKQWILLDREITVTIWQLG